MIVIAFGRRELHDRISKSTYISDNSENKAQNYQICSYTEWKVLFCLPLNSNCDIFIISFPFCDNICIIVIRSTKIFFTEPFVVQIIQINHDSFKNIDMFWHAFVIFIVDESVYIVIIPKDGRRLVIFLDLVATIDIIWIYNFHFLNRNTKAVHCIYHFIYECKFSRHKCVKIWCQSSHFGRFTSNTNAQQCMKTEGNFFHLIGFSANGWTLNLHW